MRLIIGILFLLATTLLSAQSVVTIEGAAPGYVGEQVEIYRIQDYFSMKEELIASTEVKSDSTFKFSFFSDISQKVVVRAKNNFAYLYIQPRANYDVYLPANNPYEPYKPTGNLVELAFFDLDSTDINYKILSFEAWVNNFLGTYFYTKNINGIEFAKQLDKFKDNVEKAYEKDTSEFFKTFVKFSIASLDDIQQVGHRNRYEKHDFYIKYSKVAYNNDAYMEYIKTYYKNFISRLSMEVNNRVYLGVLNSSPTQVMRALGGEYTLINMRIREMMMVKMLTDVYYNGEFPQTNIITIIDSVANHAMFEGTKVIAKNLKERLLELVEGGKAPNFSIEKGELKKTLASYTGKYIYFHFFDPDIISNVTEVQLLKSLQAKYGDDIQFVTIYKKKDSYSKEGTQALKTITWDVFELDKNHPIFKDYQIFAFPGYVLIDQYGYIVSTPALGPTPNGQGVTIERSFFYIQKKLHITEEDNK
jgi:hypothetical protein